MRQEKTRNLLGLLERLLNGLVAQSADPKIAPSRANLAMLLTRTLGVLKTIVEAV